MKLRKLTLLLISAAAVCALLPGCKNAASESVTGLEHPALRAVDRIVQYTHYTVSYNEADRLPYWTAYQLTAEHTDGPVIRKGMSFIRDERVNMMQANKVDYVRSGWTRGHMVPAGDFKWDEEAMRETFFFTNCCPQDSILNDGDWQVLERKARNMARRYGVLYIATGPVIGNRINGTIGRNDITVPDAFFKALLARKANGQYTGVGFLMQNNSKRQPLRECAMPLEKLEQITGLKFFAELPEKDAKEVKKRYIPADWGLR